MAKPRLQRITFRPRPMQRVRGRSFLGQKDNQHGSIIGSFKAEVAENCDFELNKNQGRTTLLKRKGHTQYGNSAVGAAEGLGMGAYHYYSSGTDTETLLAGMNSGSSAVIFSYSASGDWVEEAGASAFTQDTQIEFQNANNAMYLYNGSEDVMKLSSTTWSRLSSGVPMSGSGNRGKFAVWHKNMNFVAGATSNPSRVYISALADPEDFTDGYYVNVNPEDGHIITGVGQLQDYVVAFKNQGIYLLAGYSPTSISLVQRSKDIGCIAPKSIVEGKTAQGRPVIYFLGNGLDGEPAIFMFDSVNVRRISDDIQDTLNGLNTNKLTNAAGVWDGEKYKLAVADGASTYNNKELVYYPDIDQWVVNTGKSPAAYAWFEKGSDLPSLHFVDAAPSALVHQDNSGKTDSGSYIDFKWQGKHYDSNEPFMDKKWKKMWMTTNTIGDYDLSAFANVDDGSDTTLGILNLSAGSSWNTAIAWGDDLTWGNSDINKHRIALTVPRGKTFQLTFQSAHSGGQEKIYEHEIFFKPKKIK